MSAADQPAPAAPATLEQAQALLAQSERELAALRAAQEDLLRAVSHDLRAPLRHITAYTALAREGLATVALQGEAAEAPAFLETVEQAARRMARMIDGLLLLSRALRAPLRCQPVDVALLAGELARSLQAQHPGRAVQWTLPAAPAWVQADPDLLRQLLTQLLDNALKFTARSADAQISLSAQPQAHGGVQLCVRDNGAGFDPARAAALGGIFQRLHREGEFDGVGCGLATAKAIAQRHGAHLHASAALQAGCTVRLDWPAPAMRQAA